MEETTRRTGYLLKRAQNAFRARMDDALRPIGLTAAQYAVLAALDDTPELSNADLARRSFVTPQTMIRIVTDLEDRQLIERHPSDTNARVLEATITNAGRTLLAGGHSAVAQIEAAMMRDIGEDAAKTVTRLLAKMAENLEAA